MEGADLVGVLSTVLRYWGFGLGSRPDSYDIAAHTDVGCDLLPDDVSTSRQGGSCRTVPCCVLRFLGIRAEMGL